MTAPPGDQLCSMLFSTAAVSCQLCALCVVPLVVMDRISCYASTKVLLCPEYYTRCRLWSLLGLSGNVSKGFTESLCGSALACRLSQTPLPQSEKLLAYLLSLFLVFVHCHIKCTNRTAPTTCMFQHLLMRKRSHFGEPAVRPRN